MSLNQPPNTHLFKAGRFTLYWSTGLPLTMGVLNITPDSFSDGGLSSSPMAALNHAENLLKAGAHILDVGGESTRPGADNISAQDEWQRIEPILKHLVTWNVPISVDTMKVEVMRKAIDLGVDLINDVNAFQADGAVDLIAKSQVGAVIMHMQGQPKTMQKNPAYESIVTDVYDFLTERLLTLTKAGLGQNAALVDPGFGFGKTFEHNTELFQAIPRFKNLGAGVLVGVSRKRLIGEIVQQTEPKQRVIGSVAAALMAAQTGAAVVRVHDVQQTCQAFKVMQWATSPSLAWPTVALEH